MGKPKKGSKKKADDDWVDEVLKEVESLKGPEETKKQKPKQAARTSQFMSLEIEEPDEEPDEEVADWKPKHDPKKKKKDKIKNVFDALEIEDEMVDEGEDDNEKVAERKPKDESKKKKKDKKKNNFDTLEIEDEMVDEGEDGNEKVAERKPKDESKKKKKDKKKNNFDTLEIEDEMVDEGEDDNEKVAERKPKDESKKKKKDKKKNIFDATENKDEMMCIKEESSKDSDKSKETKIIDDHEDNITSTNKSKREKRRKKKFDIDDLEDFDAEEPETPKTEQKLKLKQKPEDSKDTPGIEAGNDDNDNDDDGPLIKTAAQKRAEKKEREKKKREIEKQKAKKAAKEVEEVVPLDIVKKEQTEDMQTKSSESEVLQEKEASAIPTVNEPKEISTETQEKVPQENNEPAEEENEQEEETEDKQKKKRKRKKKAGEEEEKKVRKPNKALVKQMQQQLEQLRLEEERRRKEEEERIRALEEAENRRLEKIRQEKEMKERKKQLEKERIARLKQEGKYLTKAQKEQRAKQMAMLEALKEQGITIPALTKEGQENLRRHVRYGSRKPRNKQQQQQKQEQNQQEREPAKDTEMPEVKEENKEKEVDAKSVTPESAKEEDEGEEEEEDVKDSWDADSEEEDETDKDMKAETTEEVEEKKIPEQSKEEESEESTSEESDEESDEESESESDDNKVDKTETVAERISRRKNRAELKRSTDKLRSPVICVLGHVDTGKTKILDKIRHTHVQDGEAGGITQQIGATMVPESAIKIQTAMIKDFENFDIQIPGLLIIDTPGHESFSNLRSRGSSLCDMAILVVDIMHGLEPQTIESINLLKAKKTPFVVALNKVDRLFEWKRGPDSSIINTIKKQKRNTKQEFEERVKIAIKEFAEQSLNACLFYENKDTRTYVSLIPTSAHTGDGMGDLISQVVRLTQTRMTQQLTYSEYLDGIVLEVKALPGLGTTIDVILVNGKLKEGDTLILPGIEGPIVTQIRALLTPQPLKELRVKNQYLSHKELCGAQGVKISAKELEKALAGVPIMVAEHDDEIEYCKNEVSAIMSAALKAIKLSDRGVYVQASTLGSLEALLEFLKTSKIPYAGVNIGPVHKKDVMKCSTMLEHEVQYAVILAFDVKIEREATELADHLGVKIFSAEIIYHLFDKFTEYREEQKRKRRDEFKNIAVFPCKLRILPQHIYNSRDPIVLGVTIEAGIVKEGTPLCVPSKSFVDIGVVTGIEANHKGITEARKGMEVCLKIENIPGETPKLYGRHFDHEDLLISKISRESIDAVKEYFREDLQKSDWQLMIELKKVFQIM